MSREAVLSRSRPISENLSRCRADTYRVKGKKFTIPALLTGNDASDKRFDELANDGKALLAIARLAPQDYHRFHSPVEGVIGDIKDIDGEWISALPGSRLTIDRGIV
jgi:phosphatidylserine decarboxylase